APKSSVCVATIVLPSTSTEVGTLISGAPPGFAVPICTYVLGRVSSYTVTADAVGDWLMPLPGSDVVPASTGPLLIETRAISDGRHGLGPRFSLTLSIFMPLCVESLLVDCPV